jgi:hypothetical protein
MTVRSIFDDFLGRLIDYQVVESAIFRLTPTSYVGHIASFSQSVLYSWRNMIYKAGFAILCPINTMLSIRFE